MAALPWELRGERLEEVEEGPGDDDGVVQAHHGGHSQHAVAQAWGL